MLFLYRKWNNNYFVFIFY